MPKLRDPKRTQPRMISLRISYDHLRELDTLSVVNKRSRREIIELLVHEAALALRRDPHDRIQP
jgi:hypothetical protein